MLRSKTPSSQGLRSSAGKQNAQEEHDRPLFRTYRPAPSAHSTHLQIRPDPGSSIPFAPVNRAKFRKDHAKANDNAALDRLLATEFQSGRESVSLDPAGEGGILNGAKGLGPAVLPPLGGAGRKSFDTGGRPGSGLGRQGSGRRQSNDHQGGRDRSQMGPLARNLSEKLGVRSDSTGLTGMKDREGPFRATKRRLGSARRNPQGGPSRQGNAQGGDYDEEEEELSSRALGVYIDGEGRLHDKEYDPFEKVRSLSRRKVEKRRVFGAAREDESEVGSDLSGSGVGFAGFETGRTMQRNQGKAGGTYQQQQDQRGDDWDDAQREQEEIKGNRTRSNTLNWSEYDSGISATSPRPVPIGESEFGDPTSPTRKSIGNYDPLSPMTATSSQPSSSQYVQRHASTSTRAGSTKTTQKRLEERPRSLLFPATPAQVAAQKIKERNTPQRVGTGSKSQSQAHHGHGHQTTQTTQRNHRVDDVVIEEEQLRPPVAPFNPMYGGEKRGKSPASSIKSGKARQHRDSADHTYAYGHQGGAGRRPSTQSQPHHHQYQHHLQDGVSGVQHASSSVFSAGDMGYLPSRWARGEREFRAGEEELDKYRPMEFRGTREDQQDPEWRPGTMDQIKRNWHEISLAFRFGTHRAKKKVERKVRNM